MISDVSNTSLTIAIICLGLAFALEPNGPKKDGRFKTGYKNNAPMPTKSQLTIVSQKILLVIGAIAGAIWYFGK